MAYFRNNIIGIMLLGVVALVFAETDGYRKISFYPCPKNGTLNPDHCHVTDLRVGPCRYFLDGVCYTDNTFNIKFNIVPRSEIQKPIIILEASNFYEVNTHYQKSLCEGENCLKRANETSEIKDTIVYKRPMDKEDGSLTMPIDIRLNLANETSQTGCCIQFLQGYYQ